VGKGGKSVWSHKTKDGVNVNGGGWEQQKKLSSEGGERVGSPAHCEQRGERQKGMEGPKQTKMRGKVNSFLRVGDTGWGCQKKNHYGGSE